MNQFVTEVVLHKFNGNEEPVVPVLVEVEGKKFLADETDPTKQKLVDGKPVPYEEKKTEIPKIEDLSKAELADLAKHNPALAKLLDDNKKRDEADTKRADDEKKRIEEDAKKTGKWQELAESRGTELETTKTELTQKGEQLGKYVETTKLVLEGLKKSIPKENLDLIPADFSPRQQLEYIIKNGARLGVKTNAIDGKVDKNDETPAGTEVEKLEKRMTELQKKATDRTATSAELQELRQVGMKITEVKREAAAKK